MSKLNLELIVRSVGKIATSLIAAATLATVLYACTERKTVIIRGNDPPIPPTPTISRIAFVSNRDGNNEIYIMEEDGTNAQRLTNSPASDLGPVVYKNTMFYTKDSIIYKMDLETLVETSLFIVGNTPDVSPDGNELVYKTPTSEIEVASTVDGSFLRYLTDGSDPDWSPDGSKIAFSRHPSDGVSWNPSDGIYTINSDGSNLVQLTSLIDRYYDLQPDWSPDGSKIAFRYFGLAVTDSYIKVMNSDGTNQQFLQDTGYTAGLSSYKPSWSPDGERIVFNTMPEINTQPNEVYSGSSEIYSIRSDGLDLTMLTSNSFWDGMAFWYK